MSAECVCPTVVQSREVVPPVGVDMTGIIKALGINVGMVTEEGAASGVGDVSGRWSSGGAISDCRGDRPDY
ncbi:hypothetical protein Hamer_G025266 [Homarus americanus]|uniref:Uncharacterized protein n=1 Tax=Homarus americanus TaxID=6706 RepID=A0A8J5TK07_HOMAM|nr:hypothetical protein Hamer_G025266 [Homarus americanus]